MKYEYAVEHQRLSRRDALKLGAAVSAAAVVSEGLLAGAAGAAEEEVPLVGDRRHDKKYNDEMFDVEAAKAGAWVPSRYGAGDQRGTFNELTPRRTARAMNKLNLRRGVRSYQMGEEMFNGFPAFPSEPPRLHDMFLYALGFEAPQDFIDAGGIQAAANTPLGPNQLIGFEERFAENFTFQIATQIDGLNHIGIGETFYNGFNAFDMLSPTGTKALGNETMGPVAARGVILDIVGLKVAQGATDSFFEMSGKVILADNYRITIDDIENAMHRQRVGRRLGAGDVPIFHTGWTHLARLDPGRYLSAEPGIFLAEARYFADRSVALVASDTWGLEVLDPDITGGNAFPVHQELITKNGIRIGESMVTDSAIAEHAYEGVFVATPENVPGATCGSSAPVFLSQPGPRPRHNRPKVKGS